MRIRVTAKNVRGVLGRVATGISQAGVNIEHVTDEKTLGLYTELHFLVQVSGRPQLALLMRGLRRISDVVRIVQNRSSFEDHDFRRRSRWRQVVPGIFQSRSSSYGRRSPAGRWTRNQFRQRRPDFSFARRTLVQPARADARAGA